MFHPCKNPFRCNLIDSFLSQVFIPIAALDIHPKVFGGGVQIHIYTRLLLTGFRDLCAEINIVVRCYVKLNYRHINI